LLKFWIWNISVFFEKKNYSFAKVFDKISDSYNKTTQKFEIFFQNHIEVKQKKKDVKNTNKLKKQIVNDGILKMLCI